MAPEVQASPSPSPHPEPDPPLTPMQHAGGDGWSERTPTAHSSQPSHHSAAAVVASEPHAAAARYVPRQPATRTADSGSWYSWTGGRTTGSRTPPRRPRQQPPRPHPPPSPPPQLQPPVPVAPTPPVAPQPPVPVAPTPPVASQPPVPVAPTPPVAPQPPAPARSVDRDHILSRKCPPATLQRTALVARAAAAALCLAALAVLAADCRKGWALDSYHRYSQLRYSEAVNVIGFLYSVFQFFALVELMRRKKHLIPRPKGDYFDLIMDQVLAYLLISSSSSATVRVDDWMDNWGSDPFPNVANSSIVISFLAFLVFAISSLISAYNLFRRDL